MGVACCRLEKTVLSMTGEALRRPVVGKSYLYKPQVKSYGDAIGEGNVALMAPSSRVSADPE